MPYDVSQSGQHQDPNFEELVASICARAPMHVSHPTFGGVCAYLEGFDSARNGGPLIGLHQWLVVRTKGGNNVSWAGQVEQQLSSRSPDAKLPGDEQAIAALGQLLAEFFKYRREKGLAKIFQDYSRWLLRQPWYTGPLRRDSGK